LCGFTTNCQAAPRDFEVEARAHHLPQAGSERLARQNLLATDFNVIGVGMKEDDLFVLNFPSIIHHRQWIYRQLRCRRCRSGTA
jgi:hypothetical protein